MKTAFEQMMNGLDEVEAFLAGETDGYKIHVPDEVNVKEIRTNLRMTQARFSETFGFSLDAIKHWEGGRRRPEASARTLLTVIARNPGAVLSALSIEQPGKRMNHAAPSASTSEPRRFHIDRIATKAATRSRRSRLHR
jgi:putative transcriptional regulator